ncbi:serine/threonine-protein kinase Nek11 isoform X1 [Callithrix jacchus]|uniref:serine/threonine-protein kinase Nek11 isoform X1 n=2 Tax=Callithrix jacchus TaxID=9483 RepID=UPI0004F085BD|nr:serine/threonine-protein kinase Nek11 isoform X1 [Callithrix jacchus]XP_035134675.2 serine/threonine-protein kinase Nek11 isoform X1 [Callithrix jacchus]XP_035134676.2 serine/threonine-protein kinase Nek11 isoform X1 [Callithrix jacchus]XP_035134677.2 serine/threonine-protein kinase Nek11 isoform X1 [Callithrix jacchus]XP_035134678.2 serine/threonine-protein kinase Nek11 isoform X1 [Callithrix jacchus]
MLKFQEAAKCVSGSTAISTYPNTLIARRYVLQQKLGSGSFGTVYLVSDKKAKQGEELKVLKEISVGELNPNETVQANLEAQLLSKLDHPAIVKFHASFVEQDNFCIITEYCEGRDLDYKIQEYKEAGKLFPENQIIEWFIQLLLGVDYMHERRILHRDLKSKNVFLKNNLLKIGDFGVSRLLMGSCDLATTLTGTPHYMSPEALKHQGCDTKSDIWSLACILYEMCCMNHAFAGSNFLSIVLKIVEGDTPSLPERYPKELNAIMESMFNKNPSLRPSAIEILKIPYIDEQLQHLMCRYSEMTLEDKNLDCQKETAHIINAMQKRIHLQTLRALSEVQKMTPRERMRLRKLQVADEEARKLKKIVEEKYEENNKRMQELRSRNFQQLSVDVLRESDEPTLENLPESQPTPSLDLSKLDSIVEDATSDLGYHEIPEDPLVAEEYYADTFDSYCEESDEEEEGTVLSGPEKEIKKESQPAYRTNQQDSDIEALTRCLENVLGCPSLDTKTITSMAADMSSGPKVFNSVMARTKMKRMRESAMQKLGAEVFEEVYNYLKRARHQNASEAEIRECLEKVVPRASDCFEVDQLLYFEEQLLITMRKKPTLQNHL